MREAVIVSAARTAIGKAPAGSLRHTRPDDMAAVVIDAALGRAPGFDRGRGRGRDPRLRDAGGRAGAERRAHRQPARGRCRSSASAVTINRFCSSGLQSIAFAAERIMAGFATAIVAGGTESMSLVPMGGHKPSPNPTLVDSYPDVYLTTGLVAENHAREHAITREEQDAFALRSHQRAVAAIDGGRFADEIVTGPAVALATDEGPRRDTSIEALGKLKPAFHVKGTVTAGNSSQMSDGAAAVLVMDGARARELGLTPLARFVAYATAGVEPERFGIGPVPAIRKALKIAGLTLDDIDLVELNEAFAAQVLACLRELPIDPDRLNVNGGAIALGHPLGCTGAKLTATILYEMRRRNARYGLVSMCVGGGMGAAGIFERM